MLAKTYKELFAFYQAKLKAHGLNDPQALSYNSRTTQELRFAQFLKLLPKNKLVTILDVGCGLGDFAEYLARHEYGNIKYTGLDIVPEMIAGAKQKQPNHNFICGDLFTTTLPIFDYVFSSGALNIIFTTPEEQPLHIEQAILKLWSLTKTTLAFNLLNLHCQNQFEQDCQFFYSHPATILRFCQKITPRSQLVDNYLDYDFTIAMEKT